MTKPVFLHLGAHRTGTSSFQMCLDLNRPTLQTAGFDAAYPGRDGIPGGRLRLKLPRNGDIGPVLRELHRHSPEPARGLILSEENIPGPMRPFYRGRFYPRAEVRLRSLRQALQQLGAGEIARVLLVLRRYDGLFVSAYRKRAEDNPVPPFAEIRPHLLAMDRGWPELVQAVRAILAPRELVILDYGRRGSSTALLRRLVPEVTAPLQEPGQAVNLSATDAALRQLQARYRAGETLDRAGWQAVIRAHAEAREDLGFAGFSDEETRILTERYAADLTRIAGMDGVTLLR